MPGLPPLVQEDVESLETASDEFLRRTEADCVLIIDKGGPIISQRGKVDVFDLTTIAALAAGSFCATQAIAERLGETNFSTIYQQGDQHSLLFCNIDENVLLIVIFKAEISVGVIKYYASGTVEAIAAQLRRASARSPEENLDLVSLNLVDTSNIFRQAPPS